uniref:Regulatory protein zeste n=1 Tax=Diabrotica virgifera virgifera TaxID=50390 RepID=A0A6P7GC46_DIAVI
MSGSDPEATKGLGEDKNEQVLFVNLLENFQILFDKRMITKIKNEKEAALNKLTAAFNEIIEKNLDLKQILKKFNNMKTKVKKIVEVKKTGNKKNRTDWQRKFYELWNVGENQVFHRIPGACQADVTEEIGVSL